LIFSYQFSFFDWGFHFSYIAPRDRQGEEEIAEMDYYHHVRELKEEHARKMADAPITTKVERPTLNFDMAAFAAARDSKRAASQSASASSASSSSAASLCAPTKAARVTRDEANTAANGIISATMSNDEPAVASSRASHVPLPPAVAAETPTSHNATAALSAVGSSVALHGRHQPPQHQDHPTADFDLVQHYLYTLDTSDLDELGIKHRGVTRASVAALLRYHRLRLPASAPRDKDGRLNAAIALLARFLRVSRSKSTS
jgi:hypothetical protein